MTSLVPAGHVEISAFQQSFHRSFRYQSGLIQNTVWGRYALLVRIGVNDAVALEVDGLAWHRGATDTFPTRDYFDFSFGAGVNTTVWRRGPTRLALNLHFHEIAYLDQSSSRYSKRNEQLLLALVVSRSGRLRQQRLDVWVSPAWVIDRVFQYPKFYPNDRGTSMRNLGGIVGASLLVGSRFGIFGQLTYANFWQGQSGASVVL